MSVDPKSYASQGALRDLGTDRDDKEVIRSSFKLPQGIILDSFWQKLDEIQG